MVDQRRKEKGIELESQKYNNRYPLSGRVICGNCGGTYKRKTYSKKVVLACTMHIEDKGRQLKKEEVIRFLQEQTVELDAFDDGLVRRLVEQVIVHKDGRFTVELKSGTSITVA